MTLARESMPSFLTTALAGSPYSVNKVAGDASFRSYYRVTTTDARYILMDAPPDKEDSAPFLDIARFLHPHGVPVPRILQADLQQGYLLLEDFGDTTFLLALEQGVPARQLYQAAVETLLTLQATPLDGSCIAHGRPFDYAMLRRELALFTDWYIEQIRATPISDQDRQRFDAVFDRLLGEILQQPTVLVHRDYHSRNLMWHEDTVGLLDFQDAVVGPITYDLASLLRDCYVAWDAPFRAEISALWLQGARQRLNYAPDGAARFQRDFDWMAIQRNLKAIGIFGRLSRRDGKHGYLNDIPRTMGYVRETLARYPELYPLATLIDQYAP
ncbi:MAG: phosphotransferase [Magnetococcales bacterium]|nr:phosphotransferase [Magnetococcales bacterium]MBF0116264.1 phosphotransferase [Magnetococcales bacterium]